MLSRATALLVAGAVAGAGALVLRSRWHSRRLRPPAPIPPAPAAAEIAAARDHLAQVVGEIELYRHHPRLHPWSRVARDPLVSQALAQAQDRGTWQDPWSLSAATALLHRRLLEAEDQASMEDALARGDVDFVLETARCDPRIHPAAVRQGVRVQR